MISNKLKRPKRRKPPPFRIHPAEQLEQRILLSAAPVVNDLFVRGTAWSNSFIELVSGGSPSPPGYSIPTGANQLKSLPWNNINQIGIRFDQDVTVHNSDLSIFGVNNGAGYALDPNGFTYDQGTYTAIWTLQNSLPDDRLVLILQDTVQSSAGRLDGEWTNSSQQYPSGDGSPGGAFSFFLNVVPGDGDQNDRVNVLDGLGVRAGLFKSVGDPGYSPYFDFDGSGKIDVLDGLGARGSLFTVSATPDTTGPTITASLAHDTGYSLTDSITTDPSFSAAITDSSGLAQLTVGLDAMPVGSFVDVSADLQPSGLLTLSRARLEQIFGSPLADGSHTLHIRAVDHFGNLGSLDRTFTLDTQAPAPFTFSLDPSQASGSSTTTFRTATLDGTTEPGIIVATSGGTQVFSAGDGSFQLPNAVLSLGANSVTITATDLAGNSTTSTNTITRVSPQASNQVALDWDNQVVNAIKLDASAPPVAARALAIMSAAMYDAVNAVDGSSSYLYVRMSAPLGSSEIAAAAQAAHDALVYLFPAQQATFDSQLATSLAAVTNGASKTNGIAVGQAVAAAIIAQRLHDGSTDFVDYVPGMNPGDWQPTYPAYAPALLPNYATLKPFLMTSDSQFRPAGPPDLGSAQWISDYNQVKNLGASNSTARTADQTQIAKFWADGVGTPTPAGHWNQITTQLLAAQGNVSLFDTAKLLAELNVALGDAATIAWDAKYATNFWRPITAIQDGGGNSSLTADPNWYPLINTPPFPEYVSGHSTFSAAAAVVLDSYFGSNFAFTTGSPSLAGVTRTFSSFDAAANEAGLSRIYGGIHFNTSVQDGLVAGTALGNYILARFGDTSDTSPPVVTVSNAGGASTKTNITIAGLVTDNLSGVASLVAHFDNGATFSVAYDSSGHFSVPTAFALDGSADGAHVLHLAATDYEGNAAASYDYSFTLDTRLPSLTITAPLQNDALTSSSLLTGTIDGTGSAITAFSYSFDSAGSMPVIVGADGTFSASLDLSKLATGAHVLHVTATDAAGNSTTVNLNVTLPSAIPLTVTSFTPLSGANDVGSTYRPEIFFSRPINTATLTANDFYMTDTTGTKLAATIVPSNDGTYAWLFPTNPMPGASTIMVTVDGSTIKAADNSLLDAANTGTAGSKLTYIFSTVSLVALPNTSLSGTVADPGPDLKPMSIDDIGAGPDAILGTADDIYKLPIAGVTVSIAGTNLTAVTGADGKFSFASIPSGDIKLVLTGTTATNAPSGYYFPEMVMDMEILPGQANTVMAAMARTGTGNSQPGETITNAPGVYLPRLQNSILHQVSNTVPTVIGVDAVSAPNLTPEQRALLKVTVQPNTAIGFDGNSLSNVQVGISTVPPDLVMDMLPPGLLQHGFDITVQAPGVATFTTPIAISFPNLHNAAPGSKVDLLSFDHTTGRLIFDGTLTVSADGKTINTDPGSGITHPGWHCDAPPGQVVNCRPCKDQASIDACKQNAVNQFWTAMAQAMRDFRYCVFSLGSIDGLPPCPPVGPLAQPCTIIILAVCSYRLLQAEERADQAYKDELASCDCMPSNSVSSIESSSLNASVHSEDTSVDDPFATLPSTVQQMYGIYTQAANVITPFLKSGTQITPGAAQQVSSLIAEADQLGGGDADSYLNTLVEPLPPLTPVDGSAPPYPIFYHATLIDNNGHTAEFRGTTTGDGQYNIFVGLNQRITSIAFYDPIANTYGIVYPRLRPDGGYDAPRPYLRPVDGTFGDMDGDGLADEAEFVIGTNPFRYSTANDGISDFAKVQAGVNPFGTQPFATGVVASEPLLGEANSTVSIGSTIQTTNQTTFVATGSYGLALVDTSQFDKPVVLSQLKLPGSASDVAVDSNLNIAAVAGNSGGLHLVNVADPTQPVLIQTLNAQASQVEIINGIVYAAVGSELRAYDMLTGSRLQTLSLSGGNIAGMAREGSILYTMDSNRTLRAIDLSSGHMVARGTLAMSFGGGKLFVGGSVAYASAGAGFATADVSNPDSLTPISGVDATNIEGTAIVANGSGLAVAVGNRPNIQNVPVPAIDVLDVSDPSNTAAFVTRYLLPAAPLDVAVAAGIAFVADGSGGLQIVNYRSFDNQGQAPTVNISAAVTDLDPNTAGIQVVEGSTLYVRPTVTDDAQVRNVELLVNGQVVQNDVSFPFDLSTALPTIAANGSTSVTIQVRATDTGGNTSTSAPQMLQLVPDTFPPTLVSSSVTEGAMYGEARRTITFTFSEALAASVVNASNFELVGPNGAVIPQDIQLRDDDRTIQLTYPTLTMGAYEFVLHRSAITDRAGNALGPTDAVTNFTIAQASTVWTNPAGGFWDVASNWSTGVVPGVNDDVLIDVPGNATITYRQGSSQINSLLSKNAFAITGGSLSVSSTVEVDNSFTIQNATLKDATVRPGSAGQGVTVHSNATFDGVRFDTDVDVTDNFGQAGFVGQVTFVDGAILNGTLRLGDSGGTWGTLAFSFSQALGGSGTILLGGNFNNHLDTNPSSQTVVTLGPDIKVQGTGQLGGSGSFINQGTINTAGTLQISAGITNQGTLQAQSGGTLTVAGSLTNSGTLAETSSTLNITPSAWTSTGPIQASGGAINFSGNWSNTGQITATNAALTLGGTFTTVGPMTRSGGSVKITGTWDNTGNTALLNANTGSWEVRGGTIRGGTISASGGSQIIVHQGATFDGARLDTDVDVTDNFGQAGFVGTVTLANGVILNGTLRLGDSGGTWATLAFNSSQTLGGSGTIALGGNFNNHIDANGSGVVVTIGPNLTIQGSGQLGGSGSFLNQGTITATNTMQISAGITNQGALQATSGGTLTVAGPLTNSGTLAETSGTLNITPSTWASTGPIQANGGAINFSGNWSNTGQITATNAALTLAGTFTTVGPMTRSGGSVKITGTWDNTGNTALLDANAGSWEVRNGTIRGGTISASGGSQIIVHQGATFDGARLDTDVDVTDNFGQAGFVGTVTLANGVILNGTLRLGDSGGTWATLAFNSSQTLGGSGTIALGGNFNNHIDANGSGVVVTIGPNLTIQGSGQLGGSGSFLNQGTITASGVMQIGSGGFNNSGTTQAASGGTLSINAPNWTNSGTLANNGGTLNLSSNGTNSGTIVASKGTSIGIGGSLTLNSSSTIEVDVGGTSTSQFGRLTYSSSASFAGTLNVVFVNGFSPAVGNSFQVVTYGSQTGTFSTVNATNLPAGEAINVTYNSTNLTITVAAAQQAAPGAQSSAGPVPSPSSEEIAPVLAAAIDRWSAAGLTAAQIAVLNSANVQIGALQTGYLGAAAGNTIWLDPTAAGYGWFIDQTPYDDSEFEPAGTALSAASGCAAGHYDLLTVLEHELGHLLGLFDDVGDDLMAETLALGTRRLPSAAEVDATFAAT